MPQCSWWAGSWGASLNLTDVTTNLGSEVLPPPSQANSRMFGLRALWVSPAGTKPTSLLNTRPLRFHPQRHEGKKKKAACWSQTAVFEGRDCPWALEDLCFGRKMTFTEPLLAWFPQL